MKFGVTPIDIEVGDNLVSFINKDSQDGYSADLAREIEYIQNWCKKVYGINLPNIRIRGADSDLDENTYRILLMGITRPVFSPADTIYIPLEKRIATGNLQALIDLGVSWEDIECPAGGRLIAKKDWDKVEEADDLYLWGVFGYPLLDLNELVSRNLSLFIHHQDVMTRLDSCKEEVYNQMKKAPEKLTVLTMVLKSLVNERVPIVRFNEICEKFVDLSERGTPITSIAEELRCLEEIRESLPGNEEKLSFLQLGQSFE